MLRQKLDKPVIQDLVDKNYVRLLFSQPALQLIQLRCNIGTLISRNLGDMQTLAAMIRRFRALAAVNYYILMPPGFQLQT